MRPSTGGVIAVAVGLAWAFRSLLSFVDPRFWDPITFLDWVAVISWSMALGLLAVGGWLIASLAGRGRAIGIAVSILAIGSVVAALANIVEDGLRVAWFGDVYAFGLGGVLVGMLALAVTLAVGRRWWLAALALATFAGIFSSEHGGGLLILVAWLVVAVACGRAGRATLTAN
ncbi:MAG: hypothetical protein AB1736_13360 [Chloroflexota bacterium]